jgi:hypothetical protein
MHIERRGKSMKRIIGKTQLAEFEGIFNVANKRQLAPFAFESPLHHQTGSLRFMWLNKFREFLHKFSMGIDEGRELYGKYGRD